MQIINSMESKCREAQPNDAHRALAEYNVPIITMNIDELHQRAGSKNVLAIHGKFPNIVLYEDPAPLYNEARSWVDQLTYGDRFIVIGVSEFTMIGGELPILAMSCGAEVIRINIDAETEVRKVLEHNVSHLESFESFVARELR